MTKAIILTNSDETALVDDEDFEELSKFRWLLFRALSNRLYAVRYPKQGITVLMHRSIVTVPNNREVDHKNGNGLDNRKSNLRICTHKQNMRNCKVNRKNNTSGYKGVWWRPDPKNYFEVGIRVEGKKINLGCYDDPVEAAKAYDEAAKKYYGEFAKTNF